MNAVNSFFKLFSTDTMASFLSGLVLQCACMNYWGIYLGLAKENFLHDLAAIVLASLQSRPGKAIFFASMGGGSLSWSALYCIYIHNLPFKKCNLIGLCFLQYPYEVHFAPLGLKLDIP